ncbi:MAG TPA: phosphoribosyl-ATP diphosphatase [Chloroflexi bacterium]|nr:phosphoribosyl-ATP diphosphatase [Chloroflexota bacterium]
MSTLQSLAATIQERREHPRPNSYTATLFAKGENEILKKMGEEAVEVIIAAKGETDERVIYELADFVYHTLVFLNLRGLTWEDVEAELARRFA